MAQNGQPSMRDPNCVTYKDTHPQHAGRDLSTWGGGEWSSPPDYSGRDLSVSTTPTANTKDKMIWVLGVTSDLGSGVTLKSRVKWPWFRNSWVVVHNRKIAISRDLANQNANRDCVFRDTVGKIRAWTFKICIARDRRSKHGIGKMAGSLRFSDFSDFRQKIKWP